MRPTSLLVAVTLGAVALAGCGVPVDARVDVEDDADVPGGLLSPAASEGTVPAGAAPYFKPLAAGSCAAVTIIVHSSTKFVAKRCR